MKLLMQNVLKIASHVYNIYKLIGCECWYISLVVNVLVVDVFVSLCNFTKLI